jgi:flagellar biosynthesis protein FlhF
MLVKVFESDSMQGALKKVKETLGPDALILSTRTVRKGGLGRFRKPVYEVTAAIDGPEADPPQPPQPAPARRQAEPDEELSYDKIWQAAGGRQPVRDTPQAPAPAESYPDSSAIRSEIDELKTLVLKLAGQQSGQPGRPVSPAPPPPSPPPTGREDIREMEMLKSELSRCGIAPEAASAIEGCAWEQLSPRQMQDRERLQHFFRDAIGELLRVTGALTEPLAGADGPRKIALVGPTGVGKTTTIAKLAAAGLVRGSGRMALITIDTYRIAAVEQLKVYAEIMNLPLEVVITPEHLDKALARHADKDLILIDTAGRSPRDAGSIEELLSLLGPHSGIESHLVLSAATRDRELQETVRRFGRLPLQSLIFTKLDECEQCGALLNVPYRQQMPISYLTNGQRVPEDLLEANADAVAEFILHNDDGPMP